MFRRAGLRLVNAVRGRRFTSMVVMGLLVAVVAPAASAHHRHHLSKVRGTWSNPVGSCFAHIISFDPSTGDVICTGTSDWTGTWTGSTTWTLTGNVNLATGAGSGRIDEVFTGRARDRRKGTLTFVEQFTLDATGKIDIRGEIVGSSGGLAGSHGHARWIGITNADGSGSGTYSGRWHEGRRHHKHRHRS